MTQTQTYPVTFYKSYDMAEEGHYLLFKEETEDGYKYTLEPIKEPVIEDTQVS